MIETKTCLVLVCDQCGTKASGFEDVYVHHFESREELDHYVADAEWLLDGEVVACWRCRNKKQPERFEHDHV